MAPSTSLSLAEARLRALHARLLPDWRSENELREAVRRAAGIGEYDNARLDATMAQLSPLLERRRLPDGSVELRPTANPPEPVNEIERMNREAARLAREERERREREELAARENQERLMAAQVEADRRLMNQHIDRRLKEWGLVPEDATGPQTPGELDGIPHLHIPPVIPA